MPNLSALADSLRPRGPITLGLSVQRTDGLIVVAVSGELDVLTAGRLGTALDPEVRTGTDDVALDLRATQFIDSAGLHILLNAQRRLTRSGRSLSVICQPGPIRRVFELAKLVDTLGVVGSLDERRRTSRPLGLVP